MKLVFLLLFATALQVSGKVHSQNISCSFANAPLKNVLKSIKKQSGYVFFYTAGTLDKAAPVTVNIKNVDIKKALEICLSNQPLSYKIEDKTILIISKTGQNPNPRPGEILNSSNIQQKQIQGVVTDSSGKPLGGVSVLLKGTQKGTITSMEGKYQISASKAMFCNLHLLDI